MSVIAPPGPRNLITDVEGILVGNAEDHVGISGTTVLVSERPMLAAADVRGGAPGTRETDALAPENLVEEIHAVVLSGGSVFGLEAATAITIELARKGVGFRFGDQAWPCPLVPAAVLFDLMNGGDKHWPDGPPYGELGRKALANAANAFSLGNAGAGLGAMAGALKGGLGSASAVTEGFTVGALVAINSVGSAIDAATGLPHARVVASGEEMGSVAERLASHPLFGASKLDSMTARDKAGGNTTIAIVATDAALTKAEARRLAIMAADGLSLAIRPFHTPFDGDTVFAVSTKTRPLPDPRPLALARIGAAAAQALARAVGRAMWEARSIGQSPAYRDLRRKP